MNFLRDYFSLDAVAQRPVMRGEAGGDGGMLASSVVSLLVKQVELASVVLLNKAAALSADELAKVEGPPRDPRPWILVQGLDPLTSYGMSL